MRNLAKLIRIEPAFDDPDLVRALFDWSGELFRETTHLPTRRKRTAYSCSSLAYSRI